MSQPTVNAIVLNWNNYEDTKECIESLLSQKYDDLIVTLVDNGSNDNSGQILSTEFEEVEYHETGENKGFAGGMNAGIANTRHNIDYICLINNDALFPEQDTISKLVSAMEQNDSFGVISPVVKKFPNTSRIWFEHGEVNWKRAKTTHNKENDVPDQRVQGDYIFNDYLPFCCALFNKSLFEEVGLLSEEYFLYFEDVDYCTKLRDRGYQVVTYRDTSVLHKGTASTGGELNPTFSYYITRNSLLFANYYRQRTGGLVHIHLFLWTILQIIRRIRYREIRGAFATILGIIDGWRGIKAQRRYP